MKDQETIDRFVELRAKNWSYDRVAKELNVSKQTLISWSKDLSSMIENLRMIELEAIQEKYFALREKRIELFGETLKSVKEELSKRDLKNISTEKLFNLLLSYSEALKKESSEIVFSSEEYEDTDLVFEKFKRVSIWKA